MKTTKTEQNVKNAQRLLDLRTIIKYMQSEEKTLKDYFSNLIDNDASLLVGTAILISKHEQTRSSYDPKMLDIYFKANSLDTSDFKKQTTYNLLKVKGL